MKINQQNSQKIKNMSLLCAALVILIHIDFPSGLTSRFWPISIPLIDGIADVAVPFFFVVSGYFLAFHFEEAGWWSRETKKRVSSLLVPFVLWSGIGILTVAPLDLVAHRPIGTGLYRFHGCDITWTQFLNLDLSCWPMVGPLWYVRCLFIFVVVSPIVVRLIDKFKYFWFVGIFVLPHLVGRIWPSSSIFFVYWFSLSGLLYFSVGIFLQRHGVKHRLFYSSKFAGLVGLLGLALLVVKTISAYYHVKSGVQSFLIPSLMYAFWHFMPARKLPDWLTACSFPIYLMHILFFPAIEMLNLCGGIPEIMSIEKFVIGFIGPIIVAVVLRKFMPKVALYLFGGR